MTIPYLTILYSGVISDCKRLHHNQRFILDSKGRVFRRGTKVQTPDRFAFYDNCSERLVQVEHGQIDDFEPPTDSLFLDCVEKHIFTFNHGRLCSVFDLSCDLDIRTVRCRSGEDKHVKIMDAGANIIVLPSSDIPGHQVAIRGRDLIVDVSNLMDTLTILRFESTNRACQRIEVIVIIICDLGPVTFSLINGEVSGPTSLDPPNFTQLDGPSLPPTPVLLPVTNWTGEANNIGISPDAVTVTVSGVYDIEAHLSYETTSVENIDLLALISGMYIAIVAEGSTVTAGDLTYTINSENTTLIVGVIVQGMLFATLVMSPGNATQPTTTPGTVLGLFCATPPAVGATVVSGTNVFDGIFIPSESTGSNDPIVNADFTLNIALEVVNSSDLTAISGTLRGIINGILTLEEMENVVSYVPRLLLTRGTGSIISAVPLKADRLLSEFDFLVDLLVGLLEPFAMQAILGEFDVPLNTTLLILGIVISLIGSLLTTLTTLTFSENCVAPFELYNIIDVDQVILKLHQNLLVGDILRVFYVTQDESVVDPLAPPVTINLLRSGISLSGNMIK